MNYEKRNEKFLDLIQIAMEDPVVKKRIIEVLQLSSFERRIVLNNWLEQLRLRHAPDNLLSTLSSLFDDKIAEEVLTLIDSHKI